MIPMSIMNNTATIRKHPNSRLRKEDASFSALLTLLSVKGCERNADIFRVTIEHIICINGIISNDISIKTPISPTEFFITLINPMTVSVLSDIREPNTGTNLLTANLAVFKERLSSDANKLP